MTYARVALVEVTGGPIQAQGGATCTVFDGKLKLFSKAGAPSPGSMTLSSINGELVPCINATDQELQTGDQVMVAQTVDGRWIVLQPGSSTPGSGQARFQFVTTGKMTNRQVAVKVLRAHNNAFDLGDMSPLVPGDTLTIYDPFNLYSDVEAKATGWAYLADAQSDDLSTSEIDEEHVIRYEVEECTQPINRIEGYLRSALYSNNAAEVVVDLADPNFADRELIRSSYPNIDLPEADIDDATGPSPSFTSYQKIDCQNPYYLDGVPGSKVVIERVTNKLPSDPENYLAPKARSSDSWQWEVVQVEKRFCRHIEVVSGAGGIWSKVAEFSGHWPDNTDSADGLIQGYTPTIDCDHCECVDPGVPGYAFFDSNTGNYKVVSTKSAFYGEGQDVSVVTGGYFSGCTYNTVGATMKAFCVESGGSSSSTIQFQSTPITVATGGSIEITEGCGSPCTWQWAPNTEDCQGNAQCRWLWDELLFDWVRDPQDPDCPNGCDCDKPPLPEVGSTPPNGSATFTDCTGEAGDFGWQRFLDCEHEDCNCVQPSIPYPEPYKIYETPCVGAEGSGGTQLCLTTSMATFNVISCEGAGGGGATTTPSQRSCIDIEEDCPDACANPVS